MRTGTSIPAKILSIDQAKQQIMRWRLLGKKIAFTNGCFDILHAGHIASLNEAANYADYLIVGLNADVSVKKLKGEDRPINDQDSRALLLASLSMVDGVIIFSEETPLELIKTILPDYLIKGGDYKVEEIAGSKEVVEAGGQVIINPILQGFSTTAIINKFKNPTSSTD